MSGPSPDREGILERALDRERRARRQAESILETRARDLYLANQRLDRQYADLAAAHAELKRANAQLAQSDKLAAIGQLAAGVAHEINNPVAFVTSNLNTLTRYRATMAELIGLYEGLVAQLDPGRDARLTALAERIAQYRRENDVEFLLEDSATLVEESLDGARRVTEIVQNLKTFSRMDSPEHEAVDINDGLRSTLRMAASNLRDGCRLVAEYGDLPPVQGSGGQLNQVFLNLLVNALQAIDGDGEVRVSTRADGGEVRVTVSDTGCGIAPEHLASIFDPFFTTKDVGQGTGLGLSVSFGIVENHRGRIEVTSEPGTGSTFTVVLPAAERVGAAA